MTTYHQMGHDSRNLLSADYLDAYRGAVLSPVNYTQVDIEDQINECASSRFEVIFDPQLYYPNSERGHLPSWSYFPADVDTADTGSIHWWSRQVEVLAETVRRLHPHAVCSPSVVPRVSSPQYYDLNREVADELADRLSHTDIEVLETVLVRMEDLSQAGRSEEIASIVSRATTNRVYLILRCDVVPRRELTNLEELKAAMRLIRCLEDSGVRVLVGCVSSDMILWKAAGASSCATGKFFNLRRFTPSRWEPSEPGGGQLPYWFEESLFAFLRESDLVRVLNADHLSSASNSNPYCARILELLKTTPGQPWLSLSWRQYLYWFADFEARIEAGKTSPDQVLRNAEETWEQLEAEGILMEERANDSRWLRPWRRALAEAFR